MAKVKGVANKWDGMSRDERMALIKKTGAFAGVVGKAWNELPDKVKARLTGGKVEATEPKPKTHIVGAKTTAEAKIEHAKKLIEKHTGTKQLPDVKVDGEVVRAAQKAMSPADWEKGGLMWGRWPGDAPNYAGMHFLAVFTTGQVVVPNCKDERVMGRYLKAIMDGKPVKVAKKGAIK